MSVTQLPSQHVAEDPRGSADALCGQVGGELFFPEKGGSSKEAKSICTSCDLKTACLEWALLNDERFGVWGGTSERERRRLRQQRLVAGSPTRAPQ